MRDTLDALLITQYVSAGLFGLTWGVSVLQANLHHPSARPTLGINAKFDF